MDQLVLSADSASLAALLECPEQRGPDSRRHNSFRRWLLGFVEVRVPQVLLSRCSKKRAVMEVSLVESSVVVEEAVQSLLQS